MRERTKSWMYLIVFIAVVGTWSFYHSYYPEDIYPDDYIYDRFESEEVLIDSFQTIAFDYDPDPKFGLPLLHKWTGPVRYGMYGFTTEEHKTTVSRVASMMGRLTGLDIRYVPGSDLKKSNFNLFFAPHDMLALVAEIYGGDNEEYKTAFQDAICLETSQQRRGGQINLVTNYLAIDIDEKNRSTCIMEEFLHGFGLGHRGTYRPSLFAEIGSPQRFPLNDKIMVRTLYDGRLKPGMTRAEAMPIVRQIIPELVAAVKERGEAALYQY
ncbi:MAG: DUF2927 domain-containing protein [Alphaproteobacteria bacterium]